MTHCRMESPDVTLWAGSQLPRPVSTTGLLVLTLEVAPDLGMTLWRYQCFLCPDAELNCHDRGCIAIPGTPYVL